MIHERLIKIGRKQVPAAYSHENALRLNKIESLVQLLDDKSFGRSHPQQIKVDTFHKYLIVSGE